MIIDEKDNVSVSYDGQKTARCDISAGDDVIKYGFPIGKATKEIKKGERVGPDNLSSSLSGTGKWDFSGDYEYKKPYKTGFFEGYLRKDGSAGIRNEIWIVPLVGCVCGIASKLASETGAKALIHPYGCSQLGGDLLTTQKTLAGLIKNPNVGGALVLSLGCENNTLSSFLEILGDYDEERVRFLVCQEADEITEGKRIISELIKIVSRDERTDIPISKLKIGVKCGGSDGLSGITANPLIGKVSDEFFSFGATVLMTELPEAFGAEQIVLSRSINESVFEKSAGMLSSFRKYFICHGEGIADNPSPGNIAGGITTLEEKSLGCVQKAGNVPLFGALGIGETNREDGGLYLVNGPGNDQVAVTDLTASGAVLILFSTGRGTPLSAPVPTLKISTNTPLYEKKKAWIDYDAGGILSGKERETAKKELFTLCIETAGGKETKAEKNGYFDIAIFKDGVTL